LDYADDGNILGENIKHHKEKHKKAFLEALRKDEKTYMVISCHQNTGQNHVLTSNKSFEYVAQFKYFKMTIMNQIAFTKK
jgi:hypothetical protein